MEISTLLIVNSAFLSFLLLLVLISSIILSIKQRKRDKETLAKIKKQISSKKIE